MLLGLVPPGPSAASAALPGSLADLSVAVDAVLEAPLTDKVPSPSCCCC